jgi:hypothetical protein
MTIAHVHNAVRRSSHSADFIHPIVHFIMGLMVLESRETGGTWTVQLGVHISHRTNVVRDEIAQYFQKEERVYGEQIIHKFIPLVLRVS